MRGRKPKPTALKNMHTPEKARLRNPLDEVQAPGDLAVDAEVAAPEYFTAAERAVWIEALRNAPPGMLKLIDSSVLEVWVVAHVLHRRAVVEQRKYSLVIPAPRTAFPIQSPWLPIINKQATILLKAAAELGFSPTARPRVAGALAGGADLGSGASDAGTRTETETLSGYLARSPAASVH